MSRFERWRPWTYATLILKTPLTERECTARLRERADQRTLSSILTPDRPERAALITVKGSVFSVILKSEHAKRGVASVSARGRIRRSVPGCEVSLTIGQERWQFILPAFFVLFWIATTLYIVARFIQTRTVEDVAFPSLLFIAQSITIPVLLTSIAKSPDDSAGSALLAFLVETLEATPVEEACRNVPNRIDQQPVVPHGDGLN